MAFTVRQWHSPGRGMSPRAFFIAIGMLLAAANATRADSIALVGATLVDGTGAPPVENATVVVENDRIACAGTHEDCPVKSGWRIVSLAGRYITPGLVDAHVHYSQTGWVDGRPDSLDVRDRYPYPEVIASLERHPERWHRSYLCSGVTAVFDVGGYPWTWRIKETAETPHYAAAGPLLSTVKHWVNLPAEKQFVYLENTDAAREAVAYEAANGSDAVKLWFIPSRRRGFATIKALAMATGEAAERAGLPFVVHATGLREARASLEAGATVLLHSVDDAPVDRAFIDAAVASDVIYVPTLTVHDGYYRLYRSALSGEAPAIDDPNGCVDDKTVRRVEETAGLGDRLDAGEDWLRSLRQRLDKQSETMARNLRAMRGAGATIATGTDAGNPLTLHGPSIYAEMEAMQAAGMTPAEVIVASTRNGARAMGRGDELGTIEAGKIADLLVLGSDPTETVSNFRDLERVMRAGVLRRQESLRVSHR